VLLYDVRVCGVEPTVRVTSGYGLQLDHGPEALAEADTVIVPGTHCVPVRRDGVLPPAVAEALALVPEHARWMSICTGAFVLAAAGRLDGRRATTHWARAADFRRLFPAVELDEDVLFVDDGDLLTSAGLAAGIDLCLHLLRRDHGAAVANAVARDIVAAPHREGGQAQFIDRPSVVTARTGIGETLEWALQRLGEPLTVAGLAAHARMSARGFARTFTVETGTSPMKWLNAARVNHARELLETTGTSIDDIAARCGLGTPANFRQHFRRATGTTPSEYRRMFAPA
jgi:transcriptional regulator GlxA family with amidase domain